MIRSAATDDLAPRVATRRVRFDGPSGSESLPSPLHRHDLDAIDRCVWMFVALGIVLRVVRYAQCLPFWSDECFLASNFIGRGYLDLTKPLDNGQICPLLFLWIERTAVLLLGFSEWSLRLFPLACGVASVILFERVARRLLSGASLLAAVGVFAASVHPIRHAAEVKPYAADLLAALVLVAPVSSWLVGRGRSRDLWCLLLLLPPAMAMSNAVVFAAGGLLLALAPPVWRSPRPADRAAFACCSAMLVGLFLAFHVGFGGLQGAGAIAGLKRYWAPGFPPLDDLARLPGWLLAALTGSLFAYPGGGSDGASTATFLACMVGGVSLFRGKRAAAVVALASPLGLNLLAAALQRYPFGPEARLAQYAAPGICLLAGAGFGNMLESLGPRHSRPGLLRAGIFVLLAFAIVPQVASWWTPYRTPYDRQAREFARAFWPEVGRGSIVACAHLDFGLRGRGGWQGRLAWYLCNQAAHSPQRPASDRPKFGEVGDEVPLRCVVFDTPPSTPAVTAWLARMRSDYVLHATRSIPVSSTFGDEQRPLVETWWVYEFLPRHAKSDDSTMNGDVPG